MTGGTERSFRDHLIRGDGQEDLCFAMWRPSTGAERITAIVTEPILPMAGERSVHGNASFEAAYTLRAASEARVRGQGLAFLHSHPRARGFQSLNSIDKEAEARIANLAREITGLPLVGLVCSGIDGWTGRVWCGRGRNIFPQGAENVRVVSDRLFVTYDETLMPQPRSSGKQVRTVSTWGADIQATIARLRIAVVGTGSVGMIVAETLARTGVESLGLFDFDTVERVNLDRLRGATEADARLRRSKIAVARRVLREASTADAPQHAFHELSVCEPEGLAHLLDYDLVFACADKPWPRHVMNTVAYADLIPVIEGGLKAFQNSDGSFRNAYWQTTIVRPGQVCLACLGQYDPALVPVERDGSLDDEEYISALPENSDLRARQNVAPLTLAVAANLLNHFVSFVARPSGFGEPGPLRFNSRSPRVEMIEKECIGGCYYQGDTGVGDNRVDPSGRHLAAERARAHRDQVDWRTRLSRFGSEILTKTGTTLFSR